MPWTTARHLLVQQVLFAIVRANHHLPEHVARCFSILLWLKPEYWSLITVHLWRTESIHSLLLWSSICWGWLMQTWTEPPLSLFIDYDPCWFHRCHVSWTSCILQGTFWLRIQKGECPALFLVELVISLHIYHPPETNRASEHGWKMKFLFGAYFQVLYFSFRECNLWSLSCCVISRWGHAPGGMHKSSSSLAAVVEVWALQNLKCAEFLLQLRGSFKHWKRTMRPGAQNSHSQFLWGFASFCSPKNCWTSPNSITKVCSKRHSISFLSRGHQERAGSIYQ